MKQPTSLRRYLFVGSILWGLGLLLVGLSVSFKLFESHMKARHRGSLEVYMQQVSEAISFKEDRPRIAIHILDPRFQIPTSGLYWQLDLHSDHPSAVPAPILRSASLNGSLLIVKAPKDSHHLPSARLSSGGEVHGPKLPALRQSIPFDDMRFHLTVAAEEMVLDPAHAFEERALKYLEPVLILAAVLSMVLGYLSVRRGFQPLKEIKDRLHVMRMGQSNLLTGRFPAEVRPLVDELNELITHSERTVARARADAEDLAHSLKTPLAVVTNEAERLQYAGYDETAEIIQQQTKTLRRYVESHLARSRAASIGPRSYTYCEVKISVDRLARTLMRLHADKEVAFVSDVPEELQFRGNVADLEEVLGNLIDNSWRFAEGRIELKGEQVPCEHEGDRERKEEDSCIRLCIDDDGPGLDAAQRENALRRGVRLDQERSGSGLGLTIVRDITNLYGGQMKLDSSPLGGLRVILILPGSY